MPPPPLTPIWCAEESASAPDSYVAFRATFALSASGPVTFRTLGSSWFNVWLDGAWFDEGPARFTRARPESQTYTAELAAGQHTVAFLVNHIGVSTRILEPIAPFLACSAEHAHKPVALSWKCTRFAAFTGGVRRVNPQLGFIE